MNINKNLYFLILSISLAACNDTTTPTRSNYRIPIESYFESRDDFPHCFFNYTFPAEFDDRQLKFSGVASKLKLLHELGLLEYQTKTIGKDYGRPRTFHGYNITELGEKFYSKDKGFCIGKPKLLEIKDVSKPYEERGQTYVRGSITWTIELPDWALETNFYQSKQFSSDLWYLKYNKIIKGEHREDDFMLTLKDHGWDF